MGKSIKKLTVHIRSEAACQERSWKDLVLLVRGDASGMEVGWRGGGVEVGGADRIAFRVERGRES